MSDDRWGPRVRGPPAVHTHGGGAIAIHKIVVAIQFSSRSPLHGGQHRAVSGVGDGKGDDAAAVFLYQGQDDPQTTIAAAIPMVASEKGGESPFTIVGLQ